MKKIIMCGMIVMILTMCFRYQVDAKETYGIETLGASEDYQAIMERMDEILIGLGPGSELGRQATVDDMRVEDAVKIYVDIPVFDTAGTTKELEALLTEAPYIWVLYGGVEERGIELILSNESGM